MKIRRLQLTRPVHTNSHGMRDEYEAGEFDFEPNAAGFVEVVRKTDGAAVAYPREMCVLTLEARQSSKKG